MEIFTPTLAFLLEEAKKTPFVPIRFTLEQRAPSLFFIRMSSLSARAISPPALLPPSLKFFSEAAMTLFELATFLAAKICSVMLIPIVAARPSAMLAISTFAISEMLLLDTYMEPIPMRAMGMSSIRSPPDKSFVLRLKCRIPPPG
ncbi:MAG TPA: hypothetical protein VMV90_02235 [Rectinemataceae bacterium]|nr:hypothetical protein [Rectinemataceae bacterium]